MKTTTPQHPSLAPSGSALLLVLWAVVTMSLAVLGVVQYVQYNLDEAQTLNKDFRVRQIAESGLAIALSPQIEKTDPLLSGTMEDDGHYQVVMESESARLNINMLFKTGNEAILQRLFENWKMSSSESQVVIQKIILWMGRTGARPEEYAVNREFLSVDQLGLVNGMDRVQLRKPEWRDSFTIWGDGRVDLNDASEEIIQAIFDVGERQAETFVMSRNGLDKLDNTIDDVPFENLDLAGSALGFSKQQFQPYTSLVTLESRITRIESTGSLGDYQKKLRVVLNRQAQPPVIFLWEETSS